MQGYFRSQEGQVPPLAPLWLRPCPDLLESTPLVVWGQKMLSSYTVCKSGSDLMSLASSAVKILSIKPWFHFLYDSSIRISTLASDKDSSGGDRTWGLLCLGSQKSCHIPTDLPSPIHYLHPLFSTSLLCKILVQTCDLNLECFASIRAFAAV